MEVTCRIIAEQGSTAGDGNGGLMVAAQNGKVVFDEGEMLTGDRRQERIVHHRNSRDQTTSL